MPGLHQTSSGNGQHQAKARSPIKLCSLNQRLVAVHGWHKVVTWAQLHRALHAVAIEREAGGRGAGRQWHEGHGERQGEAARPARPLQLGCRGLSMYAAPHAHCTHLWITPPRFRLCTRSSFVAAAPACQRSSKPSSASGGQCKLLVVEPWRSHMAASSPPRFVLCSTIDQCAHHAPSCGRAPR